MERKKLSVFVEELIEKFKTNQIFEKKVPIIRVKNLEFDSFVKVRVHWISRWNLTVGSIFCFISEFIGFSKRWQFTSLHKGRIDSGCSKIPEKCVLLHRKNLRWEKNLFVSLGFRRIFCQFLSFCFGVVRIHFQKKIHKNLSIQRNRADSRTQTFFAE